jgi:LL-H family phage holin
MEINFNQVLTNLVLAVLIAAIPIVVVAARALIQQQLERLKLEIGERNYWLLQSFAQDFVAAAEQTLGEANIDKKEYAVRMVSEMAQSLGIEVTREQLEALIEAAVHELNNSKLEPLEAIELEVLQPEVLDLDIGSMVRYVLPDGRHPGEVRPAAVVKIWDRVMGTSNLNVFTDGDNDYPDTDGLLWATSIMYDEDGALGTWHFPGDLEG